MICKNLYTSVVLRFSLLLFGDFYLGRDDTSFNDLQLHLGRWRLEWSSQRVNPSKTNGPDPYSSDRRQDRKSTERF
jgi:hypothetical protein